MTAKPAKSTSATVSADNLQGLIVHADEPHALRDAVEQAFHYRGDITITRRSTGEKIEGYLFDRHDQRGELVIRMIPRDSDARIVIPLSDVHALAFTGKDTASGKTFENWIRKYAEKKLAGETASIESESLDEE